MPRIRKVVGRKPDNSAGTTLRRDLHKVAPGFQRPMRSMTRRQLESDRRLAAVFAEEDAGLRYSEAWKVRI